MMKFVCVSVAALALASCGGGSTMSIPDGKGGTTKITADGDSAKSEVTMTGADGKTVTMKANSGTANFPAFAPQYPGATVGDTSDIAAEGTKMTTIQQVTSDTPDKVIAFYKGSLEKSGMKIGMTGSQNGQGFLSAGSTNPQEDKSPAAMISTETAEDGKTKVSMVITTPS
jgi:major membrane immunogen (membrane-anchored lipoprotein)